jgi:1-acyl-sn-glycerol-3-phosphate acyltransferase
MAHPGPPSAGWFPASPCGPGCRPARQGRRVSRLRVAVRLVALAAVLSGALLGVPLLPAAARRRWLAACCRGALRATGVRLRVIGALPDSRRARGGLLVANHLSWIDVLALSAVAPVRMLAKREVRDWPVVGALAARTGALFVDRAGLRGLPGTVAEMADAMRSGSLVAAFPEGTTWCGAAAGAFRRAAFQAAIDARAPVLPAAFVLRLPSGDPAPDAAFIGEDETLWESLLRVVRLPAVECVLTVVPALSADGDRRELAQRAGAAIAAVTGVPHGAEPSLPDTGAVLAA